VVVARPGSNACDEARAARPRCRAGRAREVSPSSLGRVADAGVLPLLRPTGAHEAPNGPRFLRSRACSSTGTRPRERRPTLRRACWSTRTVRSFCSRHARAAGVRVIQPAVVTSAVTRRALAPSGSGAPTWTPPISRCRRRFRRPAGPENPNGSADALPARILARRRAVPSCIQALGGRVVGVPHAPRNRQLLVFPTRQVRGGRLATACYLQLLGARSSPRRVTAERVTLFAVQTHAVTRTECVTTSASAWGDAGLGPGSDLVERRAEGVQPLSGGSNRGEHRSFGVRMPRYPRRFYTSTGCAPPVATSRGAEHYATCRTRPARLAAPRERARAIRGLRPSRAALDQRRWSCRTRSSSSSFRAVSASCGDRDGRLPSPARRNPSLFSRLGARAALHRAPKV